MFVNSHIDQFNLPQFHGPLNHIWFSILIDIFIQQYKLGTLGSDLQAVRLQDLVSKLFHSANETFLSQRKFLQLTKLFSGSIFQVVVEYLANRGVVMSTTLLSVSLLMSLLMTSHYYWRVPGFMKNTFLSDFRLQVNLHMCILIELREGAWSFPPLVMYRQDHFIYLNCYFSSNEWGLRETVSCFTRSFYVMSSNPDIFKG